MGSFGYETCRSWMTASASAVCAWPTLGASRSNQVSLCICLRSCHAQVTVVEVMNLPKFLLVRDLWLTM
jgi:hypothetical protein